MSAARKIDRFQLAFGRFREAHQSIIHLDRKKLFSGKIAGEALTDMRRIKGWTVAELLYALDVQGIKISEDSHNRYVKVASRWDELVGIAKERNIDLKDLGYMEALDLLPPSVHSLKVKAGKQRKKLGAKPGSGPQAPPANWKGKLISLHGSKSTALGKRDDPTDQVEHDSAAPVNARLERMADAGAEELAAGLSKVPTQTIMLKRLAGVKFEGDDSLTLTEEGRQQTRITAPKLRRLVEQALAPQSKPTKKAPSTKRAAR
jgi:hypothetical protein